MEFAMSSHEYITFCYFPRTLVRIWKAADLAERKDTSNMFNFSRAFLLIDSFVYTRNLNRIQKHGYKNKHCAVFFTG